MAVITTETAPASAALPPPDAIRKDGRPLGSGTRNYTNLCACSLARSLARLLREKSSGKGRTETERRGGGGNWDGEHGGRKRSNFSCTRLAAIASFGNLPKASFIRLESTSLCFPSSAPDTAFLISFQLSPGIVCFPSATRAADARRNRTRSRVTEHGGTRRTGARLARFPVRTAKWISRFPSAKSKRSRCDFLPCVEFGTFRSTGRPRLAGSGVRVLEGGVTSARK